MSVASKRPKKQADWRAHLTYAHSYVEQAKREKLKFLPRYPDVKGTLWTRIGLGLVHYGPVSGIE